MPRSEHESTSIRYSCLFPLKNLSTNASIKFTHEKFINFQTHVSYSNPTLIKFLHARAQPQKLLFIYISYVCGVVWHWLVWWWQKNIQHNNNITCLLRETQKHVFLSSMYLNNNNLQVYLKRTTMRINYSHTMRQTCLQHVTNLS